MKTRFVLLVSMLVLLLGVGALTEEVRMGAWVDEVIIREEVDTAAAVSKLEAGDIDWWIMLGITDPALFERIMVHPEIDYRFSYGAWAEIMFNTAGPVFRTGVLNPFYYPRIREAMQWLIDRDYIVGELLGGMGAPIYALPGRKFPEYARYGHIIEEIEEYYAHDPARAKEIITREMEAIGAELIDGVWHYEGTKVELRFIIRVDLYEPLFPAAGDYVADLLEELGFAVHRMYLTGPEAFAIWIPRDPLDGDYHLYTGGWGMGVIPRDWGGHFYARDTKHLRPWPRWLALEPPAEYEEVARRLYERDYTTMEEREELFEKALWMGMEFSGQILLADIAGAHPFRHDLNMALNVAGGAGAGWAQTIHFHEEGEPVPGGTVRAEQYFVFAEPWNPVDGTGASADLVHYRDALTEEGLMLDPRDGLAWPWRIERAEVYAVEGLPIDITHDWLTLEFVPEIRVPPDAWCDWCAVNQVFITCEEYWQEHPGRETAKIKSVVYYPENLFDIPMHDGTTLSLADFIMSWIYTFDRAKEESPIFDEAAVPGFKAFMENFRGVRIVQEDPLIIESYTNLWYLDAEWNVSPWWPSYGIYGIFAPWHVMAISWLAEAAKELAYGSEKAELLGVEEMDFTKGPTLPILERYLLQALEEPFIPYEPTLGKYITPEEAIDRYTKLHAWYEEKGHFVVSTAPFYLEAVHPIEKIIHLKRFPDHPDPADRWLFLLEPLGK